MCPQISCTSCFYNNDIQTPDQVSVPCTTPYFHKDTLTTPSSSRSPPLENGGRSTYARPAMHLYIMHALYFEIYTTFLEVIIDSRVKGLETAVFTLNLYTPSSLRRKCSRSSAHNEFVLIMSAFCTRCDCNGLFLVFFFGLDAHQCHVG